MGKTALRCAGVMTALTAVTTFLLWFLPQLTPPGVSPVDMRLQPEYMARLWVNLVHVMLALFGYAAAAGLWKQRSVTLATLGAVAFAFWAFIEAIGVTINIIVVNGDWRPAFATSPTPQLEANLAWFVGWWDGTFFLLLICFFIGTTALGLVAVAGKGLERAVGVLFLLAAPLTVLIAASEYFGFTAGLDMVSAIYPALQPISRFLLGVWLWRQASLRPA